MRVRDWAAATSVIAAALATTTTLPAQDTAYKWNIPAPYPRPPVPADNPMSIVKVELGRRLFYDRRMSSNDRQSCASCHRQELAFTDRRPRAIGTTGQTHPRGSMSLANIGYSPALTWGNPTMVALEDQALVPMLGTQPVELGLNGREEEFLTKLRQDTLYQRLFASAFPTEPTPISIPNVVRAIASFERTIVSMDSPYDRYRYRGERDAISASAKRGEALFFSGQRGGCFQCHGGWNLSGNVRYAGGGDAVQAAFFNTGLYNLPGALSYPAPNTGIHEFTRRPEDVGRFRPPSLRNIAVTAPYMHDGSIATLGEVLDHYAAGGRTIASGPNAGVGRLNPNKAPSVHGFSLTNDEKRDLLAFLETFTDTVFLRNPAYANPWRQR